MSMDGSLNQFRTVKTVLVSLFLLETHLMLKLRMSLGRVLALFGSNVSEKQSFKKIFFQRGPLYR